MFFSDDGEYESRLSQSKLTQLCEFDPVITFVKACDHLLYQTLVEILIPDVLRPIPGTYNYVILTAECYYNMVLLWLVIYKLVLCYSNILCGLLWQYMDRKCGLLLKFNL